MEKVAVMCVVSVKVGLKTRKPKAWIFGKPLISAWLSEERKLKVSFILRGLGSVNNMEVGTWKQQLEKLLLYSRWPSTSVDHRACRQTNIIFNVNGQMVLLYVSDNMGSHEVLSWQDRNHLWIDVSGTSFEWDNSNKASWGRPVI